jgi:uncharacterized protein involved in outer membrane biogenesis
MKKKGIWIIGIVAVVVVVVVFLLLSNIGSIIKAAVNTYGPEITKTEVRLSDVDVSLLSARAEIKGFYLGNPETFASPSAVEVASVYLDVDEKSLTRDPIIIDRIEVVAPHITYERREGTDNFKVILNNIKGKAEAQKAPKEETGEKEEGKKIIIRDFLIRDGEVTLAVSMLGEHEVTAPLPDIHLTNIGQKQGGAPPAEIADAIVAALYEKITSPDILNALDDQVKALKTGVKTATDEVTKQAKDLGGKLKGLLGE